MKKYSMWGFVVALIGFFMPVSCDISAFDFTRSFLLHYDDFSTMVENPVLIGLCICIIFACSCVGVVLLVMTLAGKKLNFAAGRTIILLALISVGIICWDYKDFFWGDMQGLQYGGYIILAGIILSFLILLFGSDDNKGKVDEG